MSDGLPLKIDGDASDVVAELRKLRGEVAGLRADTKGVSSAFEETRAKGSGAAQSLTEKWGGFAQALSATISVTKEVTAGAVALARQTMAAAAAGEQQARAARSLGGTLELVRRATADTVTAQQAWRSELTLTRSGLHLTGQEFATIARFARDHKDANETSAESLQRLTEALRQGEAGGLRTFGLAVQQGATRGTTFNSVLRQMERAARDTEPAQRTLAEETARTSEALDEGANAMARLAAHATGLPGIMREVADAVRELAGDINKMVDAEERAPAQQRAFEARVRAQQAYTQALSATGRELDSLGLRERRAALLPGADVANRLTTEQLAAATARLQRLQQSLGARGREGQVLSGEGLNASRLMEGGVTTATSAIGRQLTDAEVSAQLAGIAAARRGGGGTLARAAQDRTEAEAALRALGADLTGQVTANTSALRGAGATGPRDTAPQGAAADPMGMLQQRIALVRQLTDAERAEVEHRIALASAENDIAARGARNDVERQRIEQQGRDARAEGIRAQQSAERDQIARQRQLLQLARDTIPLLREPAKRLQVQQILNGLENEEVGINRHILEQQAEIRRIASETAAAERARVQSLKEAQYAARDEIAARYHANEIRLLESAQGRTNARAEMAGSRRLSRLQGGLQRESELADLQSPEGRAATLDEMAGQARIARVRSNLQMEFEAQKSFTERMEEQHRRRASAAEVASNLVESASQATGRALSVHIVELTKGTETAAQAAQAMGADVLVAIGNEAMAKGALETAEAISALAGVYTAGLAPGHFAAAAAYFGVGALTGVAGMALAPSAPASAGGGAAASAPARPLGAGAANDNASGGGKSEITINLGGGFVMGSPRDLAESLARLLNAPTSGFALNGSRVRMTGTGGRW